MSSRIYAKLAVTNIKNNGKTYVPFMLTAVLTVMMYYMMDTLARNDSIGNRNVTTVLFLTIPVMTLFPSSSCFTQTAFSSGGGRRRLRSTISWAWGRDTSAGCSL